ncbi:MAG: hypothetical protein WC804_14810 [Sphingomonas sp.]|uniref:hypothetical protein n=1 Tax=Sphingomonas sp. TaxID=28214 RepID=UPI00356B22B6
MWLTPDLAEDGGGFAMSRPILLAALFGLSAIAPGCSGGSAPLHDSEEILNLATAGAGDAIAAPAPSSSSPVVPEPRDTPPIRDGWMTLPPNEIEARVERLFRCGASTSARKMCGLGRNEGAGIEVLPKGGGSGSLELLRDWITIDPDDLEIRPARLPRAPFLILHRLFPQWHRSDAWLTYALLHSRHACGRQVRVGNALIFVEIDIGALNRLVGEIDVVPYRPSVERAYLACRQFRVREGDIDPLATASWADGPGSQRGR